MKLVFIVSQVTNGGAERNTAAFANALAAMGEDVHIVCLHDEPDDYPVDRRVGRHLLRTANRKLPGPKKFWDTLTQAKQLRTLRADVILPFCPQPEYLMRFWLATLFCKTKIIYTVRLNEEKDITDPIAGRQRKRARCLADGIWVQVKGQRQFFPKRLQKKIFEVPNILNPRFLKVAGSGSCNIRRFVSAGRLHPQKNQKLLIEAFARMIERTHNTDATLTIYGKSRAGYKRTEDDLRERIDEYGLRERVFLPGRASDLAEKYAEADAFVFSSDHEGCPNALMEAMAAGLPCISTDCPTGPSDLITSGKDGLLVPVGDAEAMSLAMEFLIKNPQEAARMAAEAKKRMRAWGTPEQLAEQLLFHLRRICKEC